MGHNHNHGDLKGEKLKITIILNLFITVAQIIGGFLSGSLTLLSDALHNFSDVIALIISYIADKLTHKKFTPRQTFGYKRAEIIAALINSATLIAIALMIAKEAIIRFKNPVQVNSIPVIVLAVLSILINGGSVLLLKSHSKNSLNIKSAYLHLFSDMITSVAVLISGIVMYYSNMYWIDGILSMMIALYLVYSSLGLLKKTLKILMQFTPTELDLIEIRNTLLREIPLIENIHHTHIWQLNESDYQFEAHIDIKENLLLSETSKIVLEVDKLLRKKYGIKHTLLQPEFGVNDSKNLIIDE